MRRQCEGQISMGKTGNVNISLLYISSLNFSLMWFLTGATETWVRKGEIFLLGVETEGSCVRCAKMCLHFMCE